MDLVLNEAIGRLALQFGLGQVDISMFSEIDIKIDDLSGLLLGIETDAGIVLDICITIHVSVLSPHPRNFRIKTKKHPRF